MQYPTSAEKRTRQCIRNSFSYNSLEITEKLPCAEIVATFDRSLDVRLHALIAHWENLPEPLRESIFRQVCETIILQPFTNQPHTGGDAVSPSVYMEQVVVESGEHPNDERILS